MERVGCANENWILIHEAGYQPREPLARRCAPCLLRYPRRLAAQPGSLSAIPWQGQRGWVCELAATAREALTLATMMQDSVGSTVV